jgi:hypothetical protein
MQPKPQHPSQDSSSSTIEASKGPAHETGFPAIDIASSIKEKDDPSRILKRGDLVRIVARYVI